MTSQAYQQQILDGIKGLPPELLAEITDFVYFVRQRAPGQGLTKELERLDRAELAHLEKEFDGYEQRYPRE